MSHWGTVPEQTGVLFDVRDRMTYWAADVMTRLADSTTADELEVVLDRCEDPHGPLNVLWAARGSAEELSEVVLEAARRRSERCLVEAVDHLRQADDADLEATVRFRLMFIVQFGDPDAAAQRIRTDLDDAVSVETLASRCVTVAYLVGAASSTGHLNDFDQETFARFAPATDHLYSAAVDSSVDDKDMSWANRRAYVRGRAKAPIVDKP